MAFLQLGSLKFSNNFNGYAGSLNHRTVFVILGNIIETYYNEKKPTEIIFCSFRNLRQNNLTYFEWTELFLENGRTSQLYSFAPWYTNLLVNVICFQRPVSTSGKHKAMEPQFQCLSDCQGRFWWTESSKTLDITTDKWKLFINVSEQLWCRMFYMYVWLWNLALSSSIDNCEG